MTNSILDSYRKTREIRDDFVHVPASFPSLEQITLPERRFYRDSDGIEYESVTTFLGRLSDSSALDAWRERVGQEEADRISLAASTRGTEVHLLAENYLNNGANKDIPKDTSPLARRMFMGIIKFINNIDCIAGLECQLRSKKFRLAGTSDCIGMYKSKTAVVDFKTSTKPKRVDWIDDYFTQGCIYALMHYEMTGVLVENIVILIAVEEGSAQEFIRSTKDCMPLVRKYLVKDSSPK